MWEKHYKEIDRSSWDQISTLFAVEGTGDYFRLEQGSLFFSPEKGASWESDPGGKDYRLHNKISNEELAEVIEHFMIQTPKK